MSRKSVPQRGGSVWVWSKSGQGRGQVAAVFHRALGVQPGWGARGQAEASTFGQKAPGCGAKGREGYSKAASGQNNKNESPYYTWVSCCQWFCSVREGGVGGTEGPLIRSNSKLKAGTLTAACGRP